MRKTRARAAGKSTNLKANRKGYEKEKFCKKANLLEGFLRDATDADGEQS